MHSPIVTLENRPCITSPIAIASNSLILNCGKLVEETLRLLEYFHWQHPTLFSQFVENMTGFVYLIVIIYMKKSQGTPYSEFVSFIKQCGNGIAS